MVENVAEGHEGFGVAGLAFGQLDAGLQCGQVLAKFVVKFRCQVPAQVLRHRQVAPGGVADFVGELIESRVAGRKREIAPVELVHRCAQQQCRDADDSQEQLDLDGSLGIAGTDAGDRNRDVGQRQCNGDSAPPRALREIQNGQGTQGGGKDIDPTAECLYRRGIQQQCRQQDQRYIAGPSADHAGIRAGAQHQQPQRNEHQRAVDVAQGDLQEAFQAWMRRLTAERSPGVEECVAKRGGRDGRQQSLH